MFISFDPAIRLKGINTHDQRNLDGANVFGRLNVRLGKANFFEDLVGMLSQQRRALDLGRRVGQLDRVADGKIRPALRVIAFDDGAGLAQRRLLGQLFHR